MDQLRESIQQLVEHNLHLDELATVCEQTIRQITEKKRLMKEKNCQTHVWKVDLSLHDEYSYSYCIYCQKQQLTIHCK